MKTKTIWKIHSWLGLIAGIPLVIIAFSGSLLVFKDEINGLIIPDRVLVEPSDQGYLPLDTRIQMLRDSLPNHEVAGMAFYNLPERADFAYVIEHGDDEYLHVFQNPYTGEMLGEVRSTDSELMGWILELHYNLLAGHTGIAVCGVIAVLLCLLGLSGFFIYRKFWKNFFKLNWKASARALTGNLHKRLGVISAPVFFILGLTGAVWNLYHVVEEWGHAHHEDEEHGIHRYYNTELSFDAMAAQTYDHIPDFEIHYLSFPWEDGAPIRFFGDFVEQSGLRSPYHSTVTFDAQTGEYLQHNPITDAPTWMQVYDAFTPLHYGTFGGWFTRILWCVLGAAPGYLALSGFFIWRKRR